MKRLGRGRGGDAGGKRSARHLLWQSRVQLVASIPIDAERLSDKACAFLLAYCNKHRCTPEEAMRQILITSAKRNGFDLEPGTEGAARAALVA